VRASRRIVRDAALAHPGELSQFLSRIRALAVQRIPARARPVTRVGSHRLVRAAAFRALALASPLLGARVDFAEPAHPAQQLAAQPYRSQKIELPKELQGIDYDRFRDIRFRPERSLWRDAKLPFEVAFFHMGLYFDRPVRINEISGNNVREIRFNPALFD